ncbi:MAG: S41 family peptidase, partial [Rhodospirillaceae bacterium]|nr:S41 family peptidase [Rhodospirillaceae bacterium]
IYRLLELFGDVFERVRGDYVEEVTDEKLVEAAIQGMLSSLDPHSSFLNKKHFKDMQVQTKGEFGGLGIEVTMENGFVKVVSPIDDTPAFRGGIQAGDFITHLDGKTVQGLTLSQAVEKMRGKVGAPIKLTVAREGQEPFDVDIIRDKIKIKSVRSRNDDDVGYIRITSFSAQTDVGLRATVKKIKENTGDKLRGYILDLRNNPGGLLDQAVAVSDAFLERGEIVSTRGRTVDNAQRFHAKAGDLAEGLPIIVLINGGSASASEIVAGALQDHGRAVLMGTRSFGKGSVQTIIPLGANGAMKLTTQRYFTPSGRSIQAKGIDPDILVEPARVETIKAGRKRSEADLRGALKNDQGAKKKPDAKPDAKADGKNDADANADVKDKEKEKAKTGILTRDDYQLARALDLLRGISLYRSRAIN